MDYPAEQAVFNGENIALHYDRDTLIETIERNPRWVMPHGGSLVLTIRKGLGPGVETLDVIQYGVYPMIAALEVGKNIASVMNHIRINYGTIFPADSRWNHPDEIETFLGMSVRALAFVIDSQDDTTIGREQS